RDQTQRQARRPRANGLKQLGEEGAAKHRDLGVRVALQRVDRERQAQGFAVPEKRAFGLGQAQLGMIRAECGLLHTSELAVALKERPDARVGERIAVTDRLRRRQSRLAPRLGLDRKSTRLNSSHVSISYAVFCLKKKKLREGYEAPAQLCQQLRG